MENKRILIIHLSRLGDMVQSLPAIKLLKEDNPEIKITYLGIKEFCRILINVPWIDNLVTLPWTGIKAIVEEYDKADIEALDQLWERTPELNEEYDLLINFTHNWSSSYLSEKIRAKEKKLKAKEAVGFMENYIEQIRTLSKFVDQIKVKEVCEHE